MNSREGFLQQYDNNTVNRKTHPVILRHFCGVFTKLNVDHWDHLPTSFSQSSPVYPGDVRWHHHQGFYELLRKNHTTMPLGKKMHYFVLIQASSTEAPSNRLTITRIETQPSGLSLCCLDPIVQRSKNNFSFSCPSIGNVQTPVYVHCRPRSIDCCSCKS